jgi:putative flippase GtrA
MNLEFIRFGLVGVVNTAVDFVVFILFYRGVGLDPLLANSVSFLIAVSNSYLMNHHWTFRRPDSSVSFAAYARFVMLNAGGLLISNLVILLLEGVMPLEFAKVIAIGLTFIWNYTASKLFVFNTKRT